MIIGYFLHDTPRLVTDDLGMRYGRGVLFRRLSFEMTAGEALAVTGANGAGKSTLLRILAGVLQPRRGSVRLHVGGREVSDEERPLRAGLVAPYMNVYDGFTARENLMFVARARRLNEGEERTHALLDRVGLSGRADDLVATYSSGMKQRVKVAAALLAAPPLLLLDEPSSNLDAPGRAMIEEVVHEQQEGGGLLVLATNDEREAAWCERMLRIEDYV